MKYNAEQVAFMLHEAIDQNREYKSWHCSTQHLMALVERVVAEEREACAKVCEEHGKTWEEKMLLGFQATLDDAAKAIRARGNVATNDTSQERVDEIEKHRHDTPPQRTWVGLTDEELQPIADEYRILFGSWVTDFARAIEAKLKEKNG